MKRLRATCTQPASIANDQSLPTLDQEVTDRIAAWKSLASPLPPFFIVGCSQPMGSWAQLHHLSSSTITLPVLLSTLSGGQFLGAHKMAKTATVVIETKHVNAPLVTPLPCTASLFPKVPARLFLKTPSMTPLQTVRQTVQLSVCWVVSTDHFLLDSAGSSLGN